MSEASALARVVGLPGSVLLGLGSILGTGVFVSIGVAAGVAGPMVVLAVPLAAVVATFNGLSSAQLAAAYPVSGGTYEYGHRVLTPSLGFAAGFLFLCAKSASAATAALGFAGYVLSAIGRDETPLRVAVAAAAVLALTAIVASGLRRSNTVNAAIVSLTLLGLVAFVAVGTPTALAGAPRHLAGAIPRDTGALPALFHGGALMFVAYTGYGRIATLGEEVREPARTIPRAIVLTLIATAALYAAVALVATATAGAPALAAATASAAPLAVIARGFAVPEVQWLVSVAAVTAMLGVVLNLLLGLSRVVLAMARRGDAPAALAVVHGGSPRRAVLVTGAVILAFVLLGDVRIAWSFSALTVLVYYALTNLAAWRLPAALRRQPRWIAGAGLVSCLLLAVFVEPPIAAAGASLLAIGFALRAILRRRAAA